MQSEKKQDNSVLTFDKVFLIAQIGENKFHPFALTKSQAALFRSFLQEINKDEVLTVSNALTFEITENKILENK